MSSPTMPQWMLAPRWEDGFCWWRWIWPQRKTRYRWLQIFFMFTPTWRSHFSNRLELQSLWTSWAISKYCQLISSLTQFDRSEVVSWISGTHSLGRLQLLFLKTLAPLIGKPNLGGTILIRLVWSISTEPYSHYGRMKRYEMWFALESLDPKPKKHFFMGGLENGTFSQQKVALKFRKRLPVSKFIRLVSMTSGPTVAAMFDSLQRTLASKSRIFMIGTCRYMPFVVEKDIINRVCPFGGFKHHLQEII